MTVFWGGNRMVDCVSLLSWREHLVLAVVGLPIKIDLAAQPPLASVGINIRQNRDLGTQSGFLRILATPDAEQPNAVTMLGGDRLVLFAHAPFPDEIVLHVDLRPIGMNVFDDADGIHIGDSTLAGNTFQGVSTAITLR
jgi:hypothetical protein